mgnify:CR=1 FL=1
MRFWLGRYIRLDKERSLKVVEEWRKSVDNIPLVTYGVVELIESTLTFDPSRILEKNSNIDALLKHAHECMFQYPAQELDLVFNLTSITYSDFPRLLAVNQLQQYVGTCMFVAMPHKTKRVTIRLPNEIGRAHV